MDDQDFDGYGSTINDLSGAVAGHVVQARSVGEIHFNQGLREPDPITPSQLPMAPRSFAGRARELEVLCRLRDVRDHGSLLVVLTGPAGVGKTSLALHWLHELREDFPDGQLFAHLGEAGQPAPAAAGEVLDWFLAALGVAAKRIPVEPERREALYRSVTSSRRLAILLDDAVSAAQVRPLIPAGPGSLAVVTSRFRLSGLVMDGANWIEVNPLDRSGSLLLLQALLGAGRVSSESDAAGELVDLCGGLPLALSVVCARLSTRPRRKLEREVAALRVERRRLPALSLDEISVEAVLDTSYDSLDDDARLLYRTSAAHPGREFGVEVIAAALGSSVEHAEAGLERLLATNLVIELGDGRFTFHDLLRLHALRRAEAEDTEDERAAAVDRMIAWYLDHSVRADTVIHPLRPRLGPRYGSTRSPVPFIGERDAMAWLELERNNLRSALRAAWNRGLHDLVWQLCESLWGFFLHTRHYGDWIDMHQLGIDSAQRCEDPLAEARMRSQLAFAYAKLHRYEDAAAESRRVLRLATGAHDDQTRASALSALGRAARGVGDLPAALDYFRESRDIQSGLRRWRGVALCRRRIGDVLSRLGRHDEAITELQGAADSMAELGDPTQHARALAFLGTAQLRAGQPDQATTTLFTALSLMRELGSPYYQAEILARLGEVAEAAGEPESARTYYGEAIALYTAVEDPQSETIQARLTALGPPT